MKAPFAVALLAALTLSVASPVTFATIVPFAENAIINIDVCNSGRAFLAGSGMPATIQMEAVSLFPMVAAFDRPVSASICLSVAPAIAEPPPRRSLSTC